MSDCFLGLQKFFEAFFIYKNFENDYFSVFSLYKYPVNDCFFKQILI